MATREKLVPACVAVTFADPIAAPEGSSTLPTMLPKPWAKEGIADNRSAKRRIMKPRFMPGFPLDLQSGASIEMRRACSTRPANVRVQDTRRVCIPDLFESMIRPTCSVDGHGEGK